MDQNPYSVEEELKRKLDPFFWNIVLPNWLLPTFFGVWAVAVCGLVVWGWQQDANGLKNASSNFTTIPVNESSESESQQRKH